MTRIASLAANNLLVNQIFRTQQRVFDQQVQVTSEKKSQVYTGIALDSQRLVNLENSRSALQRYIDDNEQMNTRLNIANAAIDGMRDIINDFKRNLDDFQTGAVKDLNRVKDIQEDAFRSLKSIQDLLNIEVDGKFLFAGARTTTEPVDFGLTTLAAFQAKFDGAAVTFPTSRDAHLEDFSISQDSAATPLTNWLVFARDSGTGVSTITATTAEFSNISAGTTITVSGTPSGTNDGTYTVASVSGGGTIINIQTEQFRDEVGVAGTVSYRDPNNVLVTNSVADSSLTFNQAANTLVYTDNALDALTAGAKFTVSGTSNNNASFTVSSINTSTNTITISPTRLTNQGATSSEVAGTIASSPYYKGDGVNKTHRVDENRDFTFDINATDPAFEKAIRAMSIILQGVYGTEGGLDENSERAGQALFLLESALQRTVSGTSPLGTTELTSNIAQLQIDTGYNQVLINDTNEIHRKLIGFLDTRITETENVDQATAITKLLDDQRALEASFQAFARIRQLSLTNFI